MRSVEYLGVLNIGRNGAAARNFHVLNAVVNSDIAAVVPECITVAIVPERVILQTVPERITTTVVPERITIAVVPERVILQTVPECVVIDIVPECIAIRAHYVIVTFIAKDIFLRIVFDRHIIVTCAELIKLHFS